MNAHRFGEFGVGIAFDAGQAILGVRGEVDILTAPTLAALLDTLIDEGHADVVLDFGALAFLDGSGLRVIANASARLTPAGGVLTVRSAPSATRRILDLTGVSKLVRFEASEATTAPLGPEQRLDDRSLAVNSGPADLCVDLVRVGSKPDSNKVVDAALRLVTALAAATVEGANGVSVTLERHGMLRTVASSNDTVMRMDGHQYETGEGPCLAAAAQGHRFHIESLAEEWRWPAFVPRALEEGIASILSTPLMTADRPMGALNIYSNTVGALGPRQQELAALFATQASGLLTNAGADVTDKQMASRIEEALLARTTIAQAQGMLMARQNITANDAEAFMHRSARTQEVAVLRYAAEIVASTRDHAGRSA